MIIQSLFLEHFRNHSQTAIHLSPAINLFVGKNGQGKTSILEALSFAAYLRSFVAGPDSAVIQKGYDSAKVKVKALRDNGLLYTISITIPRRGRKSIHTSSGPVSSVREIIGNIPLIVFAPEQRAISMGGPVHRRRFLNHVISQLSPSYLVALYDFYQVLRQRNALLSSSYSTQKKISLLTEWDEQFAHLAALIIDRRRQFVSEFAPLVQENYAALSDHSEQISMEYQSSIFPEGEIPMDVRDIEEEVMRQLRLRREEELQQKKTLIGPQRDELLFFLDSLPFRQCASQGQHKTLVLSLKIAEWQILEMFFSEKPVALFDDIFGDLDAERSMRVLQLFVPQTQIFITSTEDSIVSLIPDKSQYTVYTVEKGSVVEEKVVV